MKKAIVVILMLGLIITLIGNSVGMGQKTLRTPQTNVSTTTIVDTEQELEEYVPKIIIKAKWGTKPGEFGIPPKDTPKRYYGPSAITVDSNGNIYVLDRWNQRIQEFTQNGKFKREIKIKTNLSKGEYFWFHERGVAIDKDGYIFCMFSIGKGIGTIVDKRLQKFSPSGKLIKEISCPGEWHLETTPWGEVYLFVFTSDRCFRFISFEEDKIKFWGEGKIGNNGYRFLSWDFYCGPKEALTIIDPKGNKKEMEIPLAEVKLKEKFKDYKLIKLECLNVDKLNNFYVGAYYRKDYYIKIEERYNIVISKCNLKGKIIAQVHLPLRAEWSDPIINIDGQGNIYEMRWKKESGVKIIRWEINKK